MSNMNALLTGLTDSLNSYLGTQLQNKNKAQLNEQTQGDQLQRQTTLEQQKSELNLQNQKAIEVYKQTLEGKVDPQMASKVHPEAAGIVEDFNKANGRYPTLSEAKELFKPVQDMKDSNHQDQLEKQAMDRITTVRGDQSLMRAEKQRDAAAMAYDTIAKARSENRDLTQLEQSDLIGQLWQARAGKAPTDQDMKQMQDMTAKRGFNHMITYLTGDPGLVGASTNETLGNLLQFVDATGAKSDQQWEGYMAPRMVKPTGLDDDRWQHIVSTSRGVSYKDQKATSDKTYPSQKKQGADIEAKKAAVRAKLGL